jgi:hypothetical protein
LRRKVAANKVAAGGQTQGIEAEFTKRSEVNWSGKPDPAQRGCAQKINIKTNTGFQPRMLTALILLKAEAETLLAGC